MGERVSARDEGSTWSARNFIDTTNTCDLCADVSMDKGRAWCPRAGCETICSINGNGGSGSTPLGPVHCPNCSTDFCSICREPWHNGPCPDLPLGIPFDSDHIKCCPMCSVPIEKDEGCAQMMCKRCKHVFCWYCLASLDVSILDIRCSDARSRCVLSELPLRLPHIYKDIYTAVTNAVFFST